MTITLSLSLPCEEPDELAYPSGSHGTWNVLCQYRLCKSYSSKPGRMIPSSYYEAKLTNDDACHKIGGFCQATWSYLSFLQYNTTEGEVEDEWTWSTIRVSVSYVCKAKVSRLTKRSARSTRLNRLQDLVQRNATCWKEKLHQLLSNGEANCSNSGKGPERCCTSRKSYLQ